MTFTDVITWLDARLGREIELSVGTSSGGNTGASVRGTLRRGDGEVALVDGRPGDVVGYSLGDGGVQMLEGDFVEAELVQWSGASGDVSLLVEFREIHLIFTGL